MDATWILVADRSRARIFEGVGPPRALHEIADFVNPLGRASHRELTTDAEGRSLSTGLRTQSHSESPGTDAAMHEAERFSREIADYLETARTGHRYDGLWVIAPPKFLAMMRKSMSKDVRKLVEEELDKDLSRSDTREIDSLITNTRKRSQAGAKG
jgi:protein required for attachment to host cells